MVIFLVTGSRHIPERVAVEARWNAKFTEYEKQYKEDVAELKSIIFEEFPAGREKALSVNMTLFISVLIMPEYLSITCHHHGYKILHFGDNSSRVKKFLEACIMSPLPLSENLAYAPHTHTFAPLVVYVMSKKQTLQIKKV